MHAVAARTRVAPTGRERLFAKDEVIVSKTDLTGKITYANRVFVRVSGYSEEELLGTPHSLIRHPDMPRCVFKLLWDTLGSGREIFAYVVNLSQNGDHYWVLAHVTPTFDRRGQITDYHSNRRVPARRAVDAIRPVYASLLEEERRHPNRAEGLAASSAALDATLARAGLTYEQFVFSLGGADR